MSSDNLKTILDLEHEISQRINEERENFNSLLERYQNELETKILYLQEDVKRKLEEFKKDCKKRLDSKYEEDLKKLTELNKEIKNMEFSFLREIIEPYIKKVLD